MISLKPYNSFQVEAFAKHFQVISNLGDLSNLGNLSPIFILGSGCNTLFTKDWPGLVLKNNLQGKKVLSETESDVIIEVASGEDWHSLVTWAVNHNWSGIENLALIPGTVGAAVIGNIAAYGQSFDQVFDSLMAFEFATGKTQNFVKSDCQLNYRTSIFQTDFKNRYFVTSVTLKLSKSAHFDVHYFERRLSLTDELIKLNPTGNYSIKDVYQAVINIRTKKLPDWTKIGTAGSVFKNPFVPREKYLALASQIHNLQWYPTAGMSYPSNSSTPPNLVKIPAGRLLDELGWRGKVIGNVSTHTSHALVVVNLGGATGQEIFAYCELMRASVKKAYDIDLVYEIQVV